MVRFSGAEFGVGSTPAKVGQHRSEHRRNRPKVQIGHIWVEFGLSLVEFGPKLVNIGETWLNSGHFCSASAKFGRKFPYVGSVRRTVVRNRPNLDEFGDVSSNSATSWLNSDTRRRNLLTFGANIGSTLVGIGPSFLRFGPNLAETGPASTQIGQIWPELGQNLARNRQKLAGVRSNWPEIG